MDDIAAVNGRPGASSVFSTGTPRFGNNPFLSVLVAQMRSQTPLEPVGSESFMQQMGLLSSMEEQRQINESLLDLLGFQGLLARMEGLGRGTALLGQEVEYVDASGAGGRGVVEAVRVDDAGRILLDVGGKDVPLQGVVAVHGRDTGEN